LSLSRKCSCPLRAKASPVHGFVPLKENGVVVETPGPVAARPRQTITIASPSDRNASGTLRARGWVVEALRSCNARMDLMRPFGKAREGPRVSLPRLNP
jgi:hypothetical protein